MYKDAKGKEFEKPMKPLYFVVTDKGMLPQGIKQTLANIIPSYAGKSMCLSLTEKKDKRSLDQNSYYWVAIVPHVRKMRHDLGDSLSLDDVHEDLLRQFSPTIECKTASGEVYARPERSKDKDMPNMAEYITAITAFCATMGYPVPIREE